MMGKTCLKAPRSVHSIGTIIVGLLCRFEVQHERQLQRPSLVRTEALMLDASTLYISIVACEIAFWVMLVAGLAFRYLLRWRLVSTFLLVCVPLIDVALLVFTFIDLRSGTTATFAHGLAAAYVGFTVAFGSSIIRWADERFAHRFAGGPPPSKTPEQGWAAVLYEFKLWARCLAAVAIIYVLLIAGIAFVDDASKTAELNIWFRLPLGTAFFWFIFGPLWSVVFFKPTSRAAAGDS